MWWICCHNGAVLLNSTAETPLVKRMAIVAPSINSVETTPQRTIQRRRTAAMSGAGSTTLLLSRRVKCFGDHSHHCVVRRASDAHERELARSFVDRSDRNRQPLRWQ